MPTSRKTKAALAVVAAMPSIPWELMDQFVTGPMTAQGKRSVPLTPGNTPTRIVFVDR